MQSEISLNAAKLAATDPTTTTTAPATFPVAPVVTNTDQTFTGEVTLPPVEPPDEPVVESPPPVIDQVNILLDRAISLILGSQLQGGVFAAADIQRAKIHLA